VEGNEERKEQSMSSEEEDHNRTTQNNSSNTDQILTVAKVLESSVKNISPIHFSVPKTARPAARRFTGHKWAKSDSAQIDGGICRCLRMSAEFTRMNASGIHKYLWIFTNAGSMYKYL
jgi:hypothetical protein